MDGMNFTRWKEKIKFLLTAFKVYYVLEGPPVGVMTEEEQRKREQDETLCRGYIERTTNEITRRGRNSNKKDDSANAVEQVDTTGITAMVFELNIGMIQELHMASVSTTDDWWYDYGATTHVCINRDLFKTYKETEYGHEVMMGDNHTSKVIGSGNVEIQFTSGKKLTLLNVLHVPNIRKNLVSGFKLCKRHINCRTMKDMLKQDIISYNGEHKHKCEICVQVKMKRIPFTKVDRQSEMLELVNSDICELNGQLTRGGNWYFITFIDDFSIYTYVYLLKLKDHAFETFKIFKAKVENQRGKKIQILRSDRGGEYFSTKFSSYCESQGLIHQRTTPYTPQQNGVAEKKNGVLQDIINAMLVSANLPKNLWGEALLTACHVKSSSAPRRSERAKKERNLDPDFIDSQATILLVEGDNENNVVNKIPVLLNVEDAPKTYKESITSRNFAFRMEAIDDEMDSLVSNNTWEPSDLPPGSKAIGSRCVFRIKYHTDGSIQTFKA
nr:retrotransposon protein, putative, Ty1-copia subclass [Tanacetum cinerariifolium]